MLWMITGEAGSGKSAFADELAASLGREGVRLGCPPFPGVGQIWSRQGIGGEPRFSWAYSDADAALAAKIDAANLESNLLRAERRILVVDSLSGWLRERFLDEASAGRPEERANAEAALNGVLDALLAFEGKAIVVTEETRVGLFPSDRELDYVYLLAAAGRRLAEAGARVYRMTAGIASEAKGYRLPR